ncbi:MAG: thiosulfate/3-mercaptopyruvate sulfurtransferase [Vicingaceae bacterium]|jgi:thiosulfate/3-mercaptopyruvate sulfurtransferase
MLKSLVSSKWLYENLDTPHLVVLYTTLIPKKESIATEVKSQQIKGARFFDLQAIFRDQNIDLLNSFPSVEQFELGCRTLGINKNSKIVVYDSLGIYSSPRVWFLFNNMGHESVFVLNGGLEEWINSGYPTVNKKEE